MRNRQAVNKAAVAVAAIAGAGAIAFGAASAGASGAPVAARVTPAVGGPKSAFSISFTTPITTGITGKTVIFEEIQGFNTNTATYQKKTCLSSLQVDPSYGTAGTVVSASVRPATKWCAGKWGLQVLELRAPACWAQGTCAAHVFHEFGNIAISTRFKVT